MTSPVPPAALAAARALTAAAAGAKARSIYREAQAAASSRLWSAVLGDARAATSGEAAVRPPAATLPPPLAAWLAGGAAAVAASGGAPLPRPSIDPDEQHRPTPRRAARPATASVAGLGANAGYAPWLAAAAERTGVPAATIAAIVNAEAAKTRDGRWLPLSHNPRSSAAGLGQFLAGTWISEAERAGTFLYQAARASGWLGSDGKVRSEARSALLALRGDPRAAIEAVADYARHNLTQLRAAAALTDERVETVTRGAYVAHHLGVGDALHYLRDAIDPPRAARLLVAQIGVSAAAGRVARAGDAVAAHRNWLTGFIARAVKPLSFRD